MQLILPQSELEQAIKNYVNDLMNVKDGTELSIDLKAGRGLDGFTATVDIIKAGMAIPAKTVVPAAVIPAPVPVAAPVKVTPRPVAKEEPVAEEKPAEDTSVANKSEQQEAASEAKEEAPAEAPSTVRRPLFGSLKKPE
jgi:hypothetical protein